METPKLTVRTSRGVDTVIVHFDRGTEDLAFELLRQVLPELRDLDRQVRRSVDAMDPSQSPRS